jgi:hypothetical protein
MKLRTLIADDEPLARERLRLLLSHDENVQIVAECRRQLIYMDVGLPAISTLPTGAYPLLTSNLYVAGGTKPICPCYFVEGAGVSMRGSISARVAAL